MNTTSTTTLHVLEQLVNKLPIGTNLALLQLLWALLAGHFLTSRGAVHSALTAAGFDRQETQRSWSALRRGVWNIRELIVTFNAIVQEDGSWQPNEYGGYRPVPVDITAIWRPKLKGWTGSIYRQLLGKRFRGIGFGLIARVGHIDGQRYPLLRNIVRGRCSTVTEESLKIDLLKQSAATITGSDVFIHDAGVSIAEVQAAAIEHFVIRLASNCTARRSYLPAYKGKGRKPKKGVLLRPLERTWKDRVLKSTPPDVEYTFTYQKRQITARGWQRVMRTDLKVADAHELFTIWVFDDPRYKRPLVVGTNLLDANPKVVLQLYIDRWPIEQIPLVAKQLLGCHRQFVFAPISCWRLGELSLLAGNLLTWLAATSEPIATGYWDRVPKKRQDGIVDSWRGLFLQKRRLNRHDFAKSSRELTTYRVELLHTGV